MMEHEFELKLQSYLDRELSDNERQRISDNLGSNPEAKALLLELETTRNIVASSEPSRQVPESREFYWSKIQRDINRVSLEAKPQKRFLTWMASLRRYAVPAGAFAVLLIALFSTVRHTGFVARAPEAESSVNDPGAFTYRDFSTRTTLVWLSYPANDDYYPY